MSGMEQDVYRMALEIYQRSPTPDWVSFFRDVLGVGGIVRQCCKSAEELTRFEQTDEYNQIQVMVAKLREKSGDAGSKEPIRVITVRLPQSLHESLRVEAHDRHTSMNKLCISKLLQMIDAAMVPTERPASGAAASNAEQEVAAAAQQ